MNAVHRLARRILAVAAACLPLLAWAQTSTTSTLATSGTPSVYGSAVTLTATVTGSGTPTGTVSFKSGAATLAVRTLATGTALFATNALAVGSHSLTAVYSGDPDNLASTSSTVAQVVSAAATTTTLTLSPASAQLGQNVTLQAKIAGGLAAGGTVTFTAGGSSLGTATVNGAAATLAVSNLALGSHTIGASYAGDANHQASTAATASLSIGARAPMTWQYGHDAMGRMNTVVDPNALASHIFYDSLGRPIQAQQPANTGTTTLTVTDFGWDKQDALTSVTDPRLLTTTYTVKGLSRVTAQSSPDSNTTTYTYNARGQVLTSTDARGKTTTFSYDSLGRQTGASYPTGTATVFEYDGGASTYDGAKGQLTKMTDASGNTTYAYDSMGRLGTKTAVVSPRTYTINYGWGDSGSALDKPTSITYPSGSRVNYTYDSAGFVSGITVNPVNSNGIGFSSTTTVVLSSVTYTAQNQVSGWNWSNGLARTIGYDSHGQVASYTLGNPNGTTGTAGSLRTLTRDAAGRITAFTHTNNGNAVPSLDQSFTYDNLNRLTGHTLASTSFAYSYDATGNRTSRTVGGTAYTTTVEVTSNRLTQAQSAAGTATYSYDAMGNIVGDGTYTFTYNDRGRMATASVPAGTVTYSFNGLGQRVRKYGPNTVVPTSYRFNVYDEAGKMLGEYRYNVSPEYETIYLGDTPVALLKYAGSGTAGTLVTGIYNIYADHLDTPRVVTRQSNLLMWRWDTAEAFGSTAANDNPTAQGTFVYTQRFPGQVFDAETGLFQNWHREYDTAIGRYRQSDPIGLAGGVNTFAYVEGNPVSTIDPRGLQSENPFASMIPPDPFDKEHNFDPNSPPTAEELDCMRRFISERYGGEAGLKVIANFSLVSYLPGKGNLMKGGPSEAWTDAAVQGGTKFAGVLTLIQGGRFFQSAALTSETLGMGGSASAGAFTAGTAANSFGHWLEKWFKRVAPPVAVLTTTANIQAREHCICRR